MCRFTYTFYVLIVAVHLGLPITPAPSFIGTGIVWLSERSLELGVDGGIVRERAGFWTDLVCSGFSTYIGKSLLLLETKMRILLLKIVIFFFPWNIN